MFLATGSYNSRNGIDLMQVAGFAIMADRLNSSRFMSHFQSLHRGAFYATMKTTSIRKLLPEAWGFVCPVHTPDGAPCGLLNHLAIGCRPQCYPVSTEQITAVEETLAVLGVVSVSGAVLPPSYVPVLLNGRLVGYAPADDSQRIVDALRLEKIRGKLTETLEICYIDGRYGTGFRTIFISCDMGRMIRPVLHVATNRVEWIGAFEQVFLDIAMPSEPEEVAHSSHRELTASNMLSLLANLTPFSDMNQSPRNMYQCQMAKQTMGTPCHNWAYRTDNKFLRIVYPQKPISRTRQQGPYLVDAYPSGTNAVLAVICYTGYDMEDAFILNKASVERGFGHGTMYKTYQINIENDRHAAADRSHLSGIDPRSNTRVKTLDPDGLPRPGEQLQEGSALYGIVSDLSGGFHTKKMSVVGEAPYVECVRIMPSFSATMHENADTVGAIRKASVKLRFPRTPVIGDKFSSRHGQKGVTSQLWPQADMPFTESGITPDCIINPNAFPSRMTIGMLVESMAGKAGALHGLWQDCSAFKHDEKKTAVAHFGEQLQRAGYRYYGTEPLYSGVSGVEFEAEIYVGVVYYQRLVHQVKDKFQVRSYGPVNELTQQPVHGRKRGGGIRLGEMERDSLIAHGTSMLLQDRLFNCSDRTLHYVCRRCGSVLSVIPRADQASAICKGCSAGPASTAPPTVEPIYIPFVMRYLAAELAAMNIRLTIFTK
jgi:DNA-directed RNA polymerase I subunit RPA2